MTQRRAFPIQLDSLSGNQPKAKAKAKASASASRPSGAISAPRPSGLGLDSLAVRNRMVQKLAASGIQDAHVLNAMGKVERHLFVETGLVNQAYEDTSLPIGLGQTISKPNVVARMIELLRNGAAGQLGRVLEVGTGCGYQAAVLSHIATEVYSIERLKGLHEKARDNLRSFRLRNVHLSLLRQGVIAFLRLGLTNWRWGDVWWPRWSHRPDTKPWSS
jgi:protein-L-isoaspartate(D-aspartate) O-methyltransferase